MTTRSATGAAIGAALTAAGIQFAEDAAYEQLMQQYKELPAEDRTEEIDRVIRITKDEDENQSEQDRSSVCSNDTEYDAIDAELIFLSKKCEVLRLRNEVKCLQSEGNVDAVAATAAPAAPLQLRKPDFRDIEHAIVKFTGDDPTQDVSEFINNFEEMMILAGGNESFNCCVYAAHLMVLLDYCCTQMMP